MHKKVSCQTVLRIKTPTLIGFYAFGIAFGHFLEGYFNNYFLIMTLIVLISTGLVFKNNTLFNLMTLGLVFSLSGSFFSSAGNKISNKRHIANFVSNKKVSITGKLLKGAEIFKRKSRFLIKSKSLNVNGRQIDVAGNVRVTLYGRLSKEILPGDTVLIKSIKLKRPRNFKNPGMFDYERFLSSKDIYVLGSLGSKKNIKIIKSGSNLNLIRQLIILKQNIGLFFKKNTKKEAASIINAIILGDRSGLTKENKDLFKSTGVSHIFAISGLHIGFIAFLVSFVFRKVIFHFLFSCFTDIVLSGEYTRLAAAATIIPVICYTLLTGSSVSSVRASIMVVTYLLSIIFKREDEILNTIFISAFLILMFKPDSLFTPGFILSYLAVFSIVLILKKAKNEFMTEGLKNSLKLKLTNYFLISLFAYLATAPAVLFCFNSLSLYAVVTNFIVVPVASIIIVSSLISVFFSFISIKLGAIILIIPTILIDLLEKFLNLVLTLPYSYLFFPQPNIFFLYLFYTLFFLALVNKSINLKKTIIVCIALFCLIILNVFFISNKNTSNELSITFIDVGQGDSTLITFPNGKTMIVDGGSFKGSFDIGESVVVPYILNRKIRKIDYVLATHPDNDHIGGLFSIAKMLNTENFIYNGLLKIGKHTKKILYLAKNKGIKTFAITDLTELNIDKDVKVRVIHPDKRFLKEVSSKRYKNNLSIALKVTYKDISFLLSADIEKEAEMFILNKENNLKSTILKIGHHGSRTSSSKRFLKEVSPEVSTISAGYNNRFKHPAKVVLRRLKREGSKVLRTDKNGAITIRTDGRQYWIESFISE